MSHTKPFHRLLPYLVAVLTFFSVCLIYFAPMTEGRKLPMYDVANYEGMKQDIMQHRDKYHEDPQWAGRMFSGMPAYLINVEYDSIFLRKAMNALQDVAMPASLILIAMLGFWCMTLLCGINPWVGVIPALAYGLSTYFFLIVGAGHITKIVAMAYAPLMLGGVFYAFRRDMWLGAGLTALFAALEIAAQHPQITYYFGMIILAFWINELVIALCEKRLGRFAATTGLLALAAALALGSSFVSLYNIQQHGKYTTRGGSELKQEGANPEGLSLKYATDWSYGTGETMNLFIPDFMGGASSGGFEKGGPVDQALVKYSRRDLTAQLPSYWGDQPMTGGPTYLGAVAIFLAVAALFVLRGRYKWWIVAVSAVAIMLAWGRHFMWFTELFFRLVPGYDKFRTVSMTLVVVQWTVPFLGALFLWKLWKGDMDKKKLRKALLYTLYVTGGVALATAMLAGIFEYTSPIDAQLPTDVAAAMRAERQQMLSSDAWRSLLFCVLTWGVLYGMAWDKLKKGYAYAALAVLVCADLIPVNMRFVPQSSFVQPRAMEVKPTDADKTILADTTPGFRVANLTVSTFNDATTSYFHRSIGGYHGAKLQRYQDLIDRYLSKDSAQIYNMLNTRYIIFSEGGGTAPEAMLNPDANGAAWFVDAVRYAATPDEQIDLLGRIDTKREAVVEERFRQRITDGGAFLPGDAQPAAGPADTVSIERCGNDEMLREPHIELMEYRVNRLTYTYFTPTPRLAVFSEIHYPEGWTATLDGQPLDYFRADYLLRAAVLPAGQHTVVFSFAVPHFKFHSAITLICSLLILGWVVVAFVVTQFICKKKNVQEQ